jgi:hypothetical protein
MEIASKTLYEHSERIKKAAYFRIESYNHKLYEQYDKFNIRIVYRKEFDDKEKAILWLLE